MYVYTLAIMHCEALPMHVCVATQIHKSYTFKLMLVCTVVSSSILRLLAAIGLHFFVQFV